MFTTIAEAEKAAATIRKVTGRRAVVRELAHDTGGCFLDLGDGDPLNNRLADWEEVADFVLHFAPRMAGQEP